MRLHPDGYLQASTIEVLLPAGVVRRAYRVGATLLEGVEREVGKHLGLRIEGIERVKIIDQPDESVRLLRIESSWVRPSRR